MFAYTRFAEKVKPKPSLRQAKLAEGIYKVVVERTFECAGNPDFGLPTSLIIKCNGVEILSRTDGVSATETIEAELRQG